MPTFAEPTIIPSRSCAFLLLPILSLSILSQSSPQPILLDLQRKPVQRILTQYNQHQVTPLNRGTGTHYTWLYVGTPPQRVSIIMDTGSGLTAFPCSQCKTCGKHTDEPFSAVRSSSFTNITCDSSPICPDCKGDPCQVSQTYMEGSSWRATLAEDVVYFGTESSLNDTALRTELGTRYVFGCQYLETGLFITQISDGIMGLCQSEHNLITKLYKEKKIASNLFSLCFARNGGYMAIGAIDTRKHLDAVAYVPTVPDSSDYYVHVKDVIIGNKSISAKRSIQFMVDSGTTNSFFPQEWRDSLMEIFQKVTKRKDLSMFTDECVHFPVSVLDSLPPITIVLASFNNTETKLIIPASQYFDINEKGSLCSNLVARDSGNHGIFGASLMINYDVIFEPLENRIGFARATCADDSKSVDVTVISDEEVWQGRPAIVKVVGSVLIFVFFGAVFVSIRMRKKAREANWSRVRGDEDGAEEDDQLDEEDEFEELEKGGHGTGSVRFLKKDEENDLLSEEEEKEFVEIQLRKKEEDEIFDKEPEETFSRDALARM